MKRFYSEIAPVVLTLDNEVLRDGEQLTELLKEEGRTFKWLADKLRKDRATVYRWRQRVELDAGALFHIGQILDVDITRWFPKLKKLMKDYHPEDDHGSATTQIQVEEFSAKYSKTQEDVNFLKDRLHDYDTIIEAKNIVIDNQEKEIRELKARIAELESGSK